MFCFPAYSGEFYDAEREKKDVKINRSAWFWRLLAIVTSKTTREINEFY
jgi:hypothetical protein